MSTSKKDIEFYVSSFQRGERQGFNYFFRELHPPLTYFAFRFLNDRQAAGEVTDKAFIQLWYRRKTFQQYQDVKFWLYTYVRNDCINRMNQVQNQPVKRRSQDEDASLIPPINDNMLAEVVAEMYGTFERLPYDYKIIFEMLCIQAKTIHTVARELHLTVDTVRVRKARGIRLLQKEYETA